MVSPIFGKKVYVDASVLIYAIETPQQFPRLQTHFLDLFARGDLVMVTSWITFAEVLVKPLKLGDTFLEMGYRRLFAPTTHFEILNVDQDISD